MYSEFIENVNCKDTEHNYKVYKNLEVMYMCSDVDKETIYEYGRKLVDNSLSKWEIEFNEKVENEIKDCSESIDYNIEKIERYSELLSAASDNEEAKYFKSIINDLRISNRRIRSRRRELKKLIIK